MTNFSGQPHGSQPRVFAVRALVAALILGACYLVFEFGRIEGGYDVITAAEERRAFENHVEALEKEIVDLNERLTLLTTHREIDREAYTEVEASLAELQGKIQEQQDALAFYRGIVSPEDGLSGLRVQDLRLSRGNAEREYTIRLVLVQAMKHDRKVSGDVSLNIAGVQDGKEKSYSYRELLPEDGQQDWAFSFRYFQDFNRPLVLPDGFTPERIDVRVESKTRSIASIEESYSWLSRQS